MDYSNLKSGTDVRGTALGESITLTPTAAADIASAFAVWLSMRQKVAKIAVGHDSRLTAEVLTDGAADALVAAGLTVLDAGLCSTPAMFMFTQLPQTDADGAIMFTASHHPFDKNGMKFFTREGGVSSKELTEILALAGENRKLVAEHCGKRIKDDYLGYYCENMRRLIENKLGAHPLSGIKIAVDAGNGAAGFFADRILAPLGADVSGSQFLLPDGRFPFHQPNPENKEAMRSISQRVVETHSDLGVIFDTDGDRSAIVSSDGCEINRNRLIALISAVLLEEHKDAYIVTDSVTSDGLHDFIEAKGGKHIRYKRGYRNVIDFAKKLESEGKYAPLAIETSGHAALKENFFLDDGAYLAVRLIIKAVELKKEGKSLLSVISELKEPCEEYEFRLTLTAADWKKQGEQIISALTEWAEANYEVSPSNYEGIRANDGGSWFMARMSVHDPVIPINVESNVLGGAKPLINKIAEFLSDRFDVDVSKLKEF